jgi:hypothetical protein
MFTGFALVQAQIEAWSLRHVTKLPVLTLVITRDLAFSESTMIAHVRRMRIFHFFDPDVRFAFVSPLIVVLTAAEESQLSPMIPASTFPRVLDTTVRGAMIAAQSGEKSEDKSEGSGAGLVRWMRQTMKQK